MELEPGWEKKALIILAVITIIIVIYAYGPFKAETKAEIQNNTTENSAPMPAPTTPVNVSNNTTSTNITNVSVTSGSNGTYIITADQAKKIATQQGLTSGEPTKGNLMINNNNISIWIVPLMNGNILIKRVYVDGSTGVIVGSEEVKR